MSLPFLLEIGTEEIPDWMIPTALENLRLSFEKLEIPHESVTPGRHAAAPGAARRGPPRTPARFRGSASWARPKRPPRRPSPASPASRASSRKTCRWSPRPRANTTPSSEEGAGPQHHRHSRRCPARHHPQPLLPEDHVLDGQGRSALHPAHPLDRGPAGRRDHSLRTRRRALRRPDQRPSPPGRA